MIRTIKTAFINLWVWLTPQAAKHKIQSDFMRAMVDPNRRPKFGQLSQPLLRRISYGAVAQSMIQVEPLPAAARVIYDPDPDSD